MSQRMQAEHFLDVQAELGEAPLWDPATQRFYMLDIVRCRLIARDWSGGPTTEWPLPSLGGGLALCSDGRLLVATQTGLFYFDPTDGSYEFFIDPEPSVPANRLNEGKCDPEGRFWIGSICTIDRRASGGLYRVDPNGASERVLSDVVIPNCLVWSLDRKRVFFADSFRKQIWSFAYDAGTGQLGDRRIFADCSAHVGMPDGGAIDEEGFLWNAEFGGGCVRRFAPDGRVDREVTLPVTQVTSCAFVGSQLDTLVVVTAKRLLSSAERVNQPLAGDVFLIPMDVKGVAESLFG